MSTAGREESSACDKYGHLPRFFEKYAENGARLMALLQELLRKSIEEAKERELSDLHFNCQTSEQ